MADKKTLELQIKLAAEQAANQIKIFSQDIKTASQNAEGLKINQKSVNSMVKSLQTEANRAATSLKLFGGSTNELRNQQTKMKQTVLDLIDHGLKPESVEVQNLVKQYKDLDDQLSKTEAKQDGLMGVISKLKSEMGSLAVVAAAVAVDKAVMDFSKSALAVSDSFRGAKEEFGIMLGDMQAGAGLFDELQEFNFWTPFDIEQTSQAAKVLMAAKVPLGEITDYLARFGDIAQGDSQKFQSFINAFSKASAKGKADMEVLNVYIDQGVQILDALAQQMGITTAEVVDFSSKGKISFEQFNQALASMASEGGLYYNSMATAAMRLSSVQAGLEESIKSLKASIGDMLAPRVAKILEFITDIVDTINGSPILKGVLLGAITALTVAINAFAFKAMASLIVQTHAGTVALTALGTAAHAMLGPIGLVTLAVGAVVGVVATMASAQQKANEEANAAALALKKQAQGYDELKAAAEGYLKFMDNQSLSEMEETLKRYNEVIIPSYTKSLELAKNKLNATDKTITKTGRRPTSKGHYESYTYEVENPLYAQAQEAVTEAENELKKFQVQADTAAQKIESFKKRASDAITAFGTEWQDKLASTTAKIDDEEKKALDKLNKKAKETLGENYKTQKAYEEELTALKQYYANKRQEQADKEAEKAQKKEEQAQKERKRLVEQAQKEIDKFLKNGSNKKENADRDYQQSLLDLNAAAKVLYGELYALEADYITAEQNLRVKYENELKDIVISEHDLRMKQVKEEYEYRAAMALNAIEDGNRSFSNYGAYAANSTAVAISNTDLGQTLMGADPLTQLITAFIDAAMEIESVAKIINWAGTIVENIFKIIGPLFDTKLKPLSDILMQLGQTIGVILAPIINTLSLLLTPITTQLNILTDIIKIVGDMFVWLNNKVIVAFGQKIIDTINGIIQLINKLPYVEIKTLQALKTVEMSAGEVLEKSKELSDAITKQQELLKKKYQQMENAVNDQLQSQLNALKSQYELGLIQRSEYENLAAKYTNSANEKILNIEEKMKEELEKIEKNTAGFINQEESDDSEDYRGTKPNFEHPIYVTPSNTSLSKTSTQTNSCSSPVNVYVTGSVVTESEITDAVYQGIARGIQQNKYSPLPGVVA